MGIKIRKLKAGLLIIVGFVLLTIGLSLINEKNEIEEVRTLFHISNNCFEIVNHLLILSAKCYY